MLIYYEEEFWAKLQKLFAFSCCMYKRERNFCKSHWCRLIRPIDYEYPSISDCFLFLFGKRLGILLLKNIYNFRSFKIELVEISLKGLATLWATTTVLRKDTDLKGRTQYENAYIMLNNAATNTHSSGKTLPLNLIHFDVVVAFCSFNLITISAIFILFYFSYANVS